MSRVLPSIPAACDLLNRGGIVAYPTETCWGLGAAGENPEAIQRLREMKGRSDSSPISLLVPSADWAEKLARALSDSEKELIRRFWPGPLTLLVRPKADGPYSHMASPWLGLRCSSLGSAQSLAQAFGRPITSTSANLTGDPPLPDEDRVRDVFEPMGVMVLRDVESVSRTAVSTVVRVDPDGLVVLREGLVSKAQLERVLEMTGRRRG